MKNYTKHLIWHGKITEVECIDHSYAWSGSCPNTGVLRCIFCGKPSWDEQVCREPKNKKMLELLQGMI